MQIFFFTLRCAEANIIFEIIKGKVRFHTTQHAQPSNLACTAQGGQAALPRSLCSPVYIYKYIEIYRIIQTYKKNRIMQIYIFIAHLLDFCSTKLQLYYYLLFFLSLVCFSVQVQSFKVKKDKGGPIPNSPVLCSMKWSADAGFSVVEGHLTTSIDTVAWLNYTNAINATGWSFLEIKTDHRFPDKIQVSGEVLMSMLYYLFHSFASRVKKSISS